MLSLVAHAQEITPVEVRLNVLFVFERDWRVPLLPQNMVSAVLESMRS